MKNFHRSLLLGGVTALSYAFVQSLDFEVLPSKYHVISRHTHSHTGNVAPVSLREGQQKSNHHEQSDAGWLKRHRRLWHLHDAVSDASRQALVDTVAQMLSDEDCRNRRAAAELAGIHEFQHLTKALRFLLGDPNHTVRQAAAVSLARLGDIASLDAIRQLEQCKEIRHSERQHYLLARLILGDDAAQKTIDKKLNSAHPDEVSEAIRLLGCADGDQSKTKLLHFIHDQTKTTSSTHRFGTEGSSCTENRMTIRDHAFMALNQSP